MSQTLQSQYIFAPQVISDEYHVDVVKEKLTRKLPGLLPDVIDEVVVASKEHIVTSDNSRGMIHILIEGNVLT